MRVGGNGSGRLDRTGVQGQRDSPRFDAEVKTNRCQPRRLTDRA